MANRRLKTLDVHEIVRLKRMGTSHSEISRIMGKSRQTVVDYVKWATDAGFMRGPMPDVPTVHARLAESKPERLPAQQESSLSRFTGEVRGMLAARMEMAAIRTRLEERHGQPVSYEALRRLVRHLKPAKEPEVFVRIETEPGAEAQVDFGYAGLHIDPETGRLRKTWVFVMVLSYSRFAFARLVFDQSVPTWLECHRLAFEFFYGVPRRIVLDNLKAAVVKACRDDPQVQRSYREFAEHNGFLIDPNPPRRPNLKGKVEQGGVHYVKRNFLAGREPGRVDELNETLRRWCGGTAGLRIHGTTQVTPVERFVGVERGELLALPVTPYDLGSWKKAKLHADGHVTFQRAWYSAPHRLVGQMLWLRCGTRMLRIYTEDHELVATHDLGEPGERRTYPEHLPPQKLAQATLTRATCLTRAEAVGPRTLEIAELLLASRPVDKLRVAGRILALGETYPTHRLEAACRMALDQGAGDYLTVKTILHSGLDLAPAVPKPAPTMLYQFARTAREYVVAFVGAES